MNISDLQRAAEWATVNGMRLALRDEGVEIIQGVHHHIITWIQIEHAKTNILLTQMLYMREGKRT